METVKWLHKVTDSFPAGWCAFSRSLYQGPFQKCNTADYPWNNEEWNKLSNIHRKGERKTFSNSIMKNVSENCSGSRWNFLADVIFGFVTFRLIFAGGYINIWKNGSHPANVAAKNQFNTFFCYLLWIVNQSFKL